MALFIKINGEYIGIQEAANQLELKQRQMTYLRTALSEIRNTDDLHKIHVLAERALTVTGQTPTEEADNG